MTAADNQPSSETSSSMRPPQQARAPGGLFDDGVLSWPNAFDLDATALDDEMKMAGLLRTPAAWP